MLVKGSTGVYTYRIRDDLIPKMKGTVALKSKKNCDNIFRYVHYLNIKTNIWIVRCVSQIREFNGFMWSVGKYIKVTLAFKNILSYHHTYIGNYERENMSTHYNDVIMSTMVSQITSLTIVYSTVYSGADQRKHQSSAPLTFLRGIHGDQRIPRTKGQ